MKTRNNKVIGISSDLNNSCSGNFTWVCEAVLFNITVEKCLLLMAAHALSKGGKAEHFFKQPYLWDAAALRT